MNPCCVSGHSRVGETKGKIIDIAGVPTYLASPPEETKAPHAAIVIITDIFGWDFVNARLFADAQAAASGINVYLPDFFLGDSVDASLMPNLDGVEGAYAKFVNGLKYVRMFSMVAPWLYRHRQAVTEPLVHKVLDQLRANGITKLGVEGFCFGGWYVVELGNANNKDHPVDAVVATHPSMLKLPMVEALGKPAQFNCAEHDSMFPTNGLRTQSEEVLKKKDFRVEFFDYPGTSHGFAMRGDTAIDTLKVQVDRCVQESSRFLREQLFEP